MKPNLQTIRSNKIFLWLQWGCLWQKFGEQTWSSGSPGRVWRQSSSLSCSSVNCQVSASLAKDQSYGRERSSAANVSTRKWIYSKFITSFSALILRKWIKAYLFCSPRRNWHRRVSSKLQDLCKGSAFIQSFCITMEDILKFWKRPRFHFLCPAS